MSHICKYTGGGKKIIAIFHDWKDGTYIENRIEKRYVGYKYMFTFENVTKKDAIEEAYNRIYRLNDLNNGTLKIKHFPSDMRVATENKKRFKVPLVL